MSHADDQLLGDARSRLAARADVVLDEVAAASAWLRGRSEDWLGTVREVHSFAYRGDPEATHPVVDLDLLSTYRKMFDQLAEFAMTVDPYALDLRDRDVD